MRAVEEYLFAQGMPVAALMEKAALQVVRRLKVLYPRQTYPQVGILVGPGHNGGDALVVARELALAHYSVKIYCPFADLKPLSQDQACYARSLEIPFCPDLGELSRCDFLVDGFFGVGLTRPLTGGIATDIVQINTWPQPVVSIDLPSGLDTDTGQVLGCAIRARHSFCLGLWKRAYFQDPALEYMGQGERLDFGIPPQFLRAVLSQSPPLRLMTTAIASDFLARPRPLLTHKYQQGHALLICGSQPYAGAPILTALGARASGVGMLSLAVPQSLKPLLIAHCPESLVIACPETEGGAIAEVPQLEQTWQGYSVLAMGPGLTPENPILLKTVLGFPGPLILDADALNLLAQHSAQASLAQRKFPTILTPHLGEFRRLFPDIAQLKADRIQSAQRAARLSRAIILFKGAKTAIATPSGETWLIPESTPALARGGSGDVLTGLIAGLLAQPSDKTPAEIVAIAAYWHAQAGLRAVQDRGERGVDALTLAHYLGMSREIVKTPSPMMTIPNQRSDGICSLRINRAPSKLTP